MATFRVGQRVRIVDGPDMARKDWVGCEVEILDLPGWSATKPENYRISRPSRDIGPPALRYSAPPRHLVPITDPGADAFIERIKKLGREPINEREKVTK